MPTDRPDLDLTQLIKSGKMPPGMARGVDLGLVKARSQHSHRWATTAVFGVNQSAVEAMAERRLTMANLIARGDGDAANAVPAVNIQCDDQSLITMDGPGCIKCHAHWEDLNNGHGVGCPVDDKQWEEQLMAQEKNKNDILGGIFGELVARAGGEIGSPDDDAPTP